MKTMLLLALLVQAGKRPDQGAGAEPGKPAPELKLKSQDGKTDFELSAQKGKPVLLIFGSWT
jgi:hypothetical protein